MSNNSIFSFTSFFIFFLINLLPANGEGSNKSLKNILEILEHKPVACADCDYIIEPKQFLVDNAVLNLPPGSKIGIKGQNRKPIKLVNFHGTAEKPFLFINCDGQTTITSGTVGVKIHKSSFLRVSGTGSSDEYGIKISAILHGVSAENGATDYEIDHVEIAGSKSIGFIARSNPRCDGSTNRENFVQKNTLIHHNYIHDVGNEGLYVGGSHWQKTVSREGCTGLLEAELEGVRVHNNRVENTGYDGIQVGSAIRDCEIYNNIVINYGLKNSTYHQAGLQINPGTTGKIYNNYIKGGTGNAIFLTGFGNDVYNNIITDCNRNGFYVADRGPLPNNSYRIVNNTLVKVKGYALVINSEQSENNIFYNNVLINTQMLIDIIGNSKISLKNNYEAHGSNIKLFKDPDNLDYSPLQDSPLVNAGYNINDITDLNIQSDYLSNKRQSGKTIDIGAYEFQEER